MWYRLGLEVDYVFGYLDDRDLYTCLFVNRQFNNCATQFLYRSIRFEGGLTSDYSSEDYKIKVYVSLAGTDDRVGIQKAEILLGDHIQPTKFCSTHPAPGYQPSKWKASCDIPTFFRKIKLPYSSYPSPDLPVHYH